MIRFNCNCTNPIEVADDMAGGLLQCPKCGRLLDIPTLDDLANLNEDGTYRVGAKVADPEPNRLPELKRTYGHDKIATDGREIDLRPTPEDVAAAGTEYGEIDLVEQMHVSPPKYDPITGELIRPMTMRPDQVPDTPVSQIPVAVPVLGYASGQTLTRGAAAVGNPFKALLSGPNLFVMLVVFFMHTIGVMLPVGIAMLGFIASILTGALSLLAMMVLFSHYGMVLEELAIEERDELPRPLRDANLYDDVFRPFCNELTAVVLCYWPVIALLLAGRQNHLLRVAELAFLSAGTFFFPAVFLTAVTSGSFLNLWPPRVLETIACIGSRYVMYAVLFVAAALVYLLGIAGSVLGLGTIFWVLTGIRLPGFVGRLAGCLTLAIGIYLMHAFCWILGLAYQRHHVEFPWVLQRHIPDPTRPPPPPRKKPRYVKPEEKMTG